MCLINTSIKTSQAPVCVILSAQCIQRTAVHGPNKIVGRPRRRFETESETEPEITSQWSTQLHFFCAHFLKPRGPNK